MIRTVALSSLLLAAGAAPVPVRAQHAHSRTAKRPIEFPDVAGFVTLKCDFHQHSVFSDGSVWPDIRVEEAIRDVFTAPPHQTTVLQVKAPSGRASSSPLRS